MLLPCVFSLLVLKGTDATEATGRSLCVRASLSPVTIAERPVTQVCANYDGTALLQAVPHLLPDEVRSYAAAADPAVCQEPGEHVVVKVPWRGH
jgi:hypothetical protein